MATNLDFSNVPPEEVTAAPTEQQISFAQPQTQQPAETPAEKLTYDDILYNRDDILQSMYYALEALGTPVENNAKTILDSFLNTSRKLDTNIVNTISTASKVGDFNDQQKQDLAISLDAVNRMPSIFEEGSAPVGKALADYAIAGLTDPTNLMSAVIGAFTLGTGAVAARGASLGARTIAMNKIKSLATKPVLGALARDAAFTGTVGAGQNLIKQDIEKEVGLRDETDFGEAALQGVAEGLLSPAAGVGLDIGGGLAGRGLVNLAEKASPEKVGAAKNWIRNNFSPAAGLDDAQISIFERRAGEISSLGERAQDIEKTFVDNNEKTFGPQKTKQQIDLLNTAMENNPSTAPAALQQLQRLNPELVNNIRDFRNTVTDATVYGMESHLDPAIKQSFVNNATYTRNVYDKHLLKKRKVDFETYLNQNPRELGKLEGIVRADRLRSNPFYKNISDQFMDSQNRDIPSVNPTEVIKKEFKKIYESNIYSRKEEKVFTKRSTLDPSIQKLLGKNETPEARVTETISGIVDTAAKSNIIYDLAGDAVRRGSGVRLAQGATAGEASARLGNKPVVKLMEPDSKSTEFNNALFNEPYTRKVDPSLSDVWITKEYADQLRVFMDPAKSLREAAYGSVLGPLFKVFSGVQIAAKYGKTVLNPPGHVRNFASSGMSSIIAGNFTGSLNALYKYAKATPADKKLLQEEFSRSGLKSSGVELGQTLARLRDLSDLDEKSFVNKLMRLNFGKLKIGEKAEKLYALEDDLWKFGAYLDNKNKAALVLDAYPPTGTINKTNLLNEFLLNNNNLVRDVSREFQSLPATKQNQILSNFRRKYPNATPQEYALQEAYVRDNARRDVAALFPMYNRIPPVFEALRVIPVIGSFTAYPAERLRNVYNNLKMSVDNIKNGIETGNKVLLAQGRNRLLSLYAGEGAIYTAVYAINELTGNSETIDKLRTSGLLPEWKVNNAILITGTNKDGTPKYLDMSTFNPDQYIASTIMPLILAAGRGEDVSKNIDKSIYEAIRKFFDPYTDPSFSTELAGMIFDYVKNPSGDLIPDAELLGKAAKLIEPGILKEMRQLALDTGVTDNVKVLYEIDKFFNPRSFGSVPERSKSASEYVLKNLTSILGFKEESVDAKKTSGFVLRKLNNVAEQNWNDFRKDLSSTLRDPTSAYSLESYLKMYDEALKEQFIRQQGIKKLRDGLSYFMGEREANKILLSSDLSGLIPSKKDLNSVARGIHNPKTISDDMEFWRGVAKSLQEKTGQFSAQEIRNLRSNMAALERLYRGRNLLSDPPDITIGE